MSGHSHWAGIKHKKGAADAKRGKLFSKLTKNIMIAARSGADPDNNIQLRYAIDKAKEANMPRTNIDRILKKMEQGTSGDNFESIMYEGYAPGGVAILVEVVTDNRNRTASEFRKIFESKGGKMGASGCVSYMFEKKGWISVPANAVPEEKLMEVVMDAGAEDLSREGDFFEITTAPADFHIVQSALKDAGIPMESQDLVQIPSNTVAVDENIGRKVLGLIDMLEEHDDTQNVFSNSDIPQEVMEQWQNE